ncbi:MAG: RAD55 family ATPase [Rubricoccaceae bacterium]
MLRTGLSALDAPWGGLAPGESYLLVGRMSAGRAAIALQIARAVADASRCLYLSTRAPQALAANAAQAGYDLAAAYRAGKMRLMQIPPAAELAATGSDGLDEAYADLLALVADERPAAVVVEDFTPLVQFDTFERFEAAFARLRDALRAQGVALVLGLGEPANKASQQLLALLARRVDGTVRLEVLDGGERRLVLARREAAPPPAAPPPAGLDSQNDGAASGLPHPAVVSPAPDASPAADAPPEASSDVLADASASAPAPAGPFGPDSFGYDPITTPSGPQVARILPAPAPDPSLLFSGTDPFAEQDTWSLAEQGYLIDSQERPVLPPDAGAPPDPPAAEAVAPAANVTEDAFAHALDAAFAGRTADGTPFLVVALRMEPGTPPAVHFPLIVEGVCAGEDRLCLSDEARCRAVVLLPGAAADEAQALFGALQQHLHAQLGERSAEALQAIGAVTLPNGEPFTDAQALLGYVYAS